MDDNNSQINYRVSNLEKKMTQINKDFIIAIDKALNLKIELYKQNRILSIILIITLLIFVLALLIIRLIPI